MNLITGGTGLLGSHVAIRLLHLGEPVRILYRDRKDEEFLIKLADLYGWDVSRAMMDLEWAQGDILDVSSLSTAMKGINHVYHCAAAVSYHKRDRDHMYLVNVEGTANVVNAAMAEGVLKLCHTSSISALGRLYHMQNVKESDAWSDSPVHTHYGITKHLAENEIWRGIEEGLKAVIVNPGLIIGPGRRGESSGAIFEHILKQWPYYPIGGTGFVHPTDVAEVMLKLMISDSSGERYTVTAQNILYEQLWKMAAAEMNCKTPSREIPAWLPRIAWAWEGIREVLTGKRASVTKESLGNMKQRFLYDNGKITEKFGIQFKPLQEAIVDAVDFSYR